MKKSNTQSIGEVINEYLKALKLDSKIKETRILNKWDQIVGKTVAKATSNLYIKNRVLYIYLKSSVVRNELFMIRQGIIAKINSMAEETIIDDIILK